MRLSMHSNSAFIYFFNDFIIKALNQHCIVAGSMASFAGLHLSLDYPKKKIWSLKIMTAVIAYL